MSLSKKQRKFTVMVGNLVLWAHSKGYELTYGHAWRDKETQARMVAEGLSRVRHSNHMDRLAVDFNLFVNGVYTEDREDYRRLGEYWEGLGGHWGGRFGVKEEDYDTKVGWDSGHFEYRG